MIIKITIFFLSKIRGYKQNKNVEFMELVDLHYIYIN